MVEPVLVRSPQRPSVANPPIDPEAVLMCEKCKQPTRQRYVITRRANTASIAFERIYSCMCYKTDRRYGLLAQ